jgi:exonuclease III
VWECCVTMATIPVATFLLLFPLLWLSAQNLMIKNSLSFSTVNCNSLNTSVSAGNNQILKINSITMLGSDIILLSDTRLSNRNNVSCANDVAKLFRTNKFDSYDCLFNSSRNKRGVGILINKKISYVVNARIDDPDENYLAVQLTLKGEEIIVCSIYGPNVQDVSFFNKLTRDISLLKDNRDTPTVIAGDWNCTYSADPVELNIDCLNMRNIPNLQHSIRLLELCNELNLSDPFRFKHFDKKEYTYAPRTLDKNNKSRLDFFLISDSLLNNSIKCDILPGLQCKLLDHKACTLELNKPVFRSIGAPLISNKILQADTLEFVVKCTVAETYLIHVIPVDGLNTNELLNVIGRIKVLITKCGLDWHLKPNISPTEELIRLRTERLTTISNLMSQIPLEALANYETVPEPDIFLEVLLNNVRNEVCSFQAFFCKEKNMEMQSALKNLVELKKDYSGNAEAIKNLENKITIINEENLKIELEKYAVFEYLNNEKISPKFLSLARGNKNEANLTQICDAEGNKFPDPDSRKKYINDYFAGIYRSVPGKVNAYEGCIEEFLGEEILANDAIRNSKLSIDQKNWCDRDFSLFELDNAVASLKNSSAGGPDGMSVKFIKRFWPLFRIPVRNYAKCCINKGQLTDSFKTAAIRLIPKKGNASEIKNWRPISLLNVMYKVIAKSLNNRLKKIAGKILGRAQKGFVQDRYIQECLINIIEGIQWSKKNNIPAFVLALDQAKAFDSIDHNFLREVYTFFGFGENFIRMITTLTTNRNAFIIQEDNTHGEKFPLECGNGQGIATSPLQFNFGLQILLFKIEFCPLIKSVFCSEAFVPASLPVPSGNRLERKVLPAIMGPEDDDRDHGPPEEALGTVRVPLDNKVEAFADDNSVLSKKSVSLPYKQYW